MIYGDFATVRAEWIRGSSFPLLIRKRVASYFIYF
jgi:hypothetical protein